MILADRAGWPATDRLREVDLRLRAVSVASLALGVGLAGCTDVEQPVSTTTSTVVALTTTSVVSTTTTPPAVSTTANSTSSTTTTEPVVEVGGLGPPCTPAACSEESAAWPDADYRFDGRTGVLGWLGQTANYESGYDYEILAGVVTDMSVRPLEVEGSVIDFTVVSMYFGDNPVTGKPIIGDFVVGAGEWAPSADLANCKDPLREGGCTSFAHKFDMSLAEALTVLQRGLAVPIRVITDQGPMLGCAADVLPGWDVGCSFVRDQWLNFTGFHRQLVDSMDGGTEPDSTGLGWITELVIGGLVLP